MRVLKLLILTVAALLLANAAHAVETHTRLWLASVFTGSMSADKKIKFYLEPNLRFVDNEYKFQQTRIWLGLGYQPTPRLILYAGDAPVVTRNSDGTYSHTNIVWQQANWTAFNSARLKVVSRSRLEELKDNDESPWAITFRERLQLKIPMPIETYSFVVSDELFFNVKNPAWRASASFISQNRASFGIDKKVTKVTSISLAYINQYLFTSPNQMSNILQLATEMNFG